MVRGRQEIGHFIGLARVTKFFGVGIERVREWQEAGAPFYRIGQVWHSNYYELWEWLKVYYAREADARLGQRKRGAK